jgi:hypothetical protein
MYVGGFNNGKKNGTGTMIEADGTEIYGFWLSGKYIGHPDDYGCIQGNCENGQGTYRWIEGVKQIGEWKDKYIGEWRDGLRHGEGIMTWGDGSRYIGEWKDSLLHGKGTFTWNGNKYIGELKDSLFHGNGTLTWENGDKYIGEWESGEQHGLGKYILLELHIYFPNPCCSPDSHSPMYLSPFSHVRVPFP